MKAIVYGGSGFLGSHVADVLTKKGNQVTIFDVKASPYLQKGQKMIVGDILDEKKVAQSIKGQDVVYNFAGYSDIELASSHPLETVKANILGNCIILEQAKQHKIKRYVFASSVYVYSAAGSFYRASKQACEAYIETYAKVYGLPYTILRFGSLYGPRSNQQSGINMLLKQAIEKKKIVYWGTGEETREYVHVHDAAICSVDILDKKHTNACVLITGNQSIKIKDLLCMIREIMDHKIHIQCRPGARPDLSDLHYVITPYSFMPKEGKKLLHAPYTDLGQGLLSLMAEIYAEKNDKD